MNRVPPSLRSVSWTRIFGLSAFLFLSPFIQAASAQTMISSQGKGHRGGLRPSRRPSFHVTTVRSLRWLVGEQSTNGSWEENEETTAFVLGTMISFWDGDSVFEEEFLPAVSNAVVWLLQRNMEDFTEDLESPQATLDLALWMILKRWPEGPFGEQISTRLLLRHGGSWPDEAQLEAFVDNRMTILSGISDMQCFQNAKSPSSAARIALSACFRRGMNDEFRSIVLSSFSSSQLLTTNSAPSLVAQSILSGHWEDASDPAERIRTTTLVLSALMASNSLSRTELLCLLVLSLNVGSSPTAIPTPPAAAGMEDTPATPDNRIQFDPVDDDVINQLQLAGFDEEDICLVSTIGPHSSHGEMHCASNVVRSRRNPTP